MSHIRTRAALPLAALALVLLAGCGGSVSGTGSNGSGSGHASVTNNSGTPAATVTVQAGQSTAPLPSDVPAPPNASLQHEYTAQVNGQNATVWQYLMPSSSSTSTSTPRAVATYYQQALQAKGWTPLATPAATPSTGVPATAQVYEKDGSTATIATSYVGGSSGPIAIIITVAK